MLPVNYHDVLDALPRVHAVLPPTPLYQWPGLSRCLGCRFHLKHENHQPVGAFKVRGGINLVGTLSEEERGAGILAVSTGNHGQSLAFAARRFGVSCTIVVPTGNNPDKNRAIRQLGAELIEYGRDFDEARQHAEQRARQGPRYVHSANEPKLIAGVGSMAWEIFEVLPDPDVILVSEDELRHAAYQLLQHTHNLAEGAGAAALAAAWKHRDRFRDQTVVGILSGGNLNLAELPCILAVAPRPGS